MGHAEPDTFVRETVSRRTLPELQLRVPTEADRREFIAAMRASATLHHPWISGCCSDVEFDALLRRAADERQDINVLYRPHDGVIVGFFNIGEIVRGLLQSAYLGYGAVAAYAGQGYMSAGMQLLLARAFDDLGLHRIEANIQPGNARSLALARRSGFVREGFSEAYLKINGKWRDHERWAIRAEQWREARGAERGSHGAGRGSHGAERGSHGRAHR